MANSGGPRRLITIGAQAVVKSWGSLAGLAGGGKLTGDPIENGILDNYVGAVIL